MKKDMEWVVSIVNPNDFRGHLRYLAAYKGWLYGTNGACAFRIRTKKLKGVYSLASGRKLMKTAPDKYYKRLHEAFQENPFEPEDRKVADLKKFVFVVGPKTKVFQIGQGYFNQKYIRLALHRQKTLFGSDAPAADCPFRGSNRYGEFLVMPIQVYHEEDIIPQKAA